jgi:hypothetical protein
VIVSCDTPGNVVVWDKSASNVVATVGAINVESSVSLDKEFFAAVADMSFNDVGVIVSSANGVASKLTLGLHGLLKNNGCSRDVSGKLLGVLNYLNDNGKTNTVIIPDTGTVAIGRRVGTVLD